MSVSAVPDVRTTHASSDVRHLVNCLPVDAYLLDGIPRVKWMDMHGASLDEPFFFQTVERVKRHALHMTESVTGIEALIQLEKISDSIAPSGFIFHTSRCGSTLLSNACRTLEGAVVVSEAAVVEKIASRFFSHSPADSQRILLNSILLRSAIGAFGQRRLGTERRLFVKFSALSALQFERIRRIWPDVPCVFMFRDPLEVMVSNLGNLPEWMQFASLPDQGAAVTGTKESEALQMSSEEVCARALGRLYTAGVGIRAAGGLLLDYDDISPQTLIETIELFGLAISDPEKAAIHEVAEVYSKDSGFERKFEPDASHKQTAATSEMRSAVDRWAMEPYRRLKRLTATRQDNLTET